MVPNAVKCSGGVGEKVECRVVGGLKINRGASPILPILYALAAGQVVVLPFPFSDLSRKKLSPALLLADAGRGDWIACQITSNPYADEVVILAIQSNYI